MNKFETPDLGLAAFISMVWHDKPGWAKCIGLKGNLWYFESDITKEEWKVSYLSSEARNHDVTLMSMRNMVTDERHKNVSG